MQNTVETRSAKRINSSFDGNASRASLSTSLHQLPTNQKIREGNDFQVQVPETAESVVETKPLEEDYVERETCLWKPSGSVFGGYPNLMDYCKKAFTQYGLSIERALFILLLSKYDLELAGQKLRMQTVFEEPFSEDDQFTFRHALNCYGKNFTKIRQMIPHKSVYALVQHYYKTKKYQHYKSTMDADNMMQDSDSSEDECKAIDKKDVRHDSVCDNCHNVVKKVYSVNELELCMTCKMYFKSTNQHRPCRQLDRPKRRVVCPPDMKNIAMKFVEMAQPAEPTTNFEDADDSGELQIACPKVTRCQQIINQTKQEWSNTDLTQIRAFLQQTAPSNAKTRLSYTWTKYEKDTAFHALILNKGNYQAVAEILTTKTADMVKAFFEEFQETINEAIQNRQKKWTKHY
uniref:REST corepressor n=1 Tax=Ditylenchus dipsaci TaxID=166011 RepID=A0A915EKZ0_9BILA